MSVTTKRFAAIDILRGIIMVIMALDHVRDYFHIDAITGTPTDLATTTPELFFTRWITHFCAPIFVFLSGLSAYISSRNKTKQQLSSFLIKRGFWLLFVEIAIMSLILTFNPKYNLILLLVLWAIGWSMVTLGLLVRLGYKWILGIGLILFFGHNIFDYMSPLSGPADVILKTLFTSSGTVVPLSATHIVVISYAILPWTGIMLLGYAIGCYYDKEIATQTRKHFLIKAGMALLLIFIVLRATNLYGDPSPWQEQPTGLYTFLSFLNVTKYPVSLLYSCLTIGVGLLLLAFLENTNNRLTKFFAVYGRVPFYYYVGHFLLIHLLCMGAFLVHRPGEPISDGISPFLFSPANFGFPLPVVYGVWLAIVLLMYYPCYRYDKYKQANKQKWWLGYL